MDTEQAPSTTSPSESQAAGKENAKPAAKESVAPRFRTYSAAEFDSLNIPKPKLLLEPWLPAGSGAMVYGWRGTGKTWLALGIANAIATGGTFLRWRAPEPRRVLYIDGEMSPAELQSRARIIRGDTPLSPNLTFLPLMLQDRGLDLSQKDDCVALTRYIGGQDIVILDNISCLSTADENDAAGWMPTKQFGLTLRRQGIAVLWIHHSGKSRQQRGTSRREDDLAAVIALRQPQDYAETDGCRFQVHYEKHRGFSGPDASPFEAALGGDGRDGLTFSHRDIVDPDTTAVLALTGQGLSIRKIAAATDISKSAVQRILSKAGAVPSVPPLHNGTAGQSGGFWEKVKCLS